MSRDLEIIATAASRLVLDGAALDPAGRARFAAIVEKALASRGAFMRAQFSLFLIALRWLPFLRWGKPLHALSPERQDAFLRWLEGNPLRSLRLGFWGLKTLVCMGYYGQPELSSRFGYNPKRDGNAELHAR